MNKSTFPKWAITILIVLIIIFLGIVGGVIYLAYNPAIAAVPGSILSLFVRQKVDVLGHYIYLRAIQDPDQDKDGLSDAAETQIYGTDPKKFDTNGTGVSDGQYIYGIYKKSFDNNDETLLTQYREKFAQYKPSFGSSAVTPLFLENASLQEMFNIRSTETYNLYVGLPDDLKQIVRQALDVRKNGEYQKSLDLLLEAISKNPDSSLLKYHLGLTYHGMKQYDKAISIYESIVNDPKVKSPLLYSDMASAYLAIENNNKFVQTLQKSIREFPEDLFQYSRLASYYQSQNQLDSAVKVLNEGLKVEPRYADYYNSLAIIAHLKGDVKGELSLYQKAVSYDFLYDAGHENISILYAEMQSDLKGALTEALIAIEINPTPNHISRVVMLYSELGQAELSKKYEDDLLEMKNIDAPAYNALGLKYLDVNNQKAEAYFRKAIATDPKLPNPYNNLGIVLDSTGRVEESAVSYMKAIELNPNYANAYSNLGIYYTEKKQYTQALSNFNMAVKLNQNLFRPYQNIAYVYRMLDDKVNEKLYYEKAIQFGCKDPVVIERLRILTQ